MSGSKRMEVQSEIYEESAFKGEETGNGSSIALEFLCMNNDVEFDQDGDLVVSKKQKLHIEFVRTTTLDMVGLQLWRGALFLSDFILSERSLFENKVVLELASGVGLTSIVAGIVAKEVIATDIDQAEVLDLISRNIERNNHNLKAKMSVKPLNFYQQEWSIEMKRILEKTDVVIAADVIYDDQLTEAFVRCLTKILNEPPKKTFFLALEKRYVFTMADLDAVPPCFDHFLNYLHNYWKSAPMSSWKIENVETDFSQFFQYERTKQLVLFKITT